MSPVFMRRPVQMKYAASAAHGSRASSGRRLFPTRLHRPVQMKYAAKAAHGSRASREDRSSLLDCTRASRGKMSVGKSA